MVGVPDVFQHTPLAVTVAPPSAVTVPPQAADEVVIDVGEDVVTAGRLKLNVVKLFTEP
jgi:hypothetical protein